LIDRVQKRELDGAPFFFSFSLPPLASQKEGKSGYREGKKKLYSSIVSAKRKESCACRQPIKKIVSKEEEESILSEDYKLAHCILFHFSSSSRSTFED